MRKINKLSFKELVEKNKEELLSDQQALDKLHEKLEAKMQIKPQKNYY